MDFCKNCDIRTKCDVAGSHPYDNDVYHNCKYKKITADAYKSDKPTSGFIARCVECKKDFTDYYKGRYKNNEYVCYDCYPKTFFEVQRPLCDYFNKELYEEYYKKRKK